MRRFLIVLLICCPLRAMATENLMQDVQNGSNVTINDGIIAQISADSSLNMIWKFQIFYNNDKHMGLGDNWSFEQPWNFVDNKIGWFSYTFTITADLTDLAFFTFGLNGVERDTKVSFDIKDVQRGEIYTLQWRVLNNTQGSISWTDMRLVHCGDGYELALGDTNCSRACENQPVTGGHIPPDMPRVDEPNTCTYNPENLICNNGYSQIGSACEQHCTAGISHFHFGDTRNVLYNRKIGTPALCVQYNDRVCYGRLSAGNDTGLNVNVNGAIYHLTD